MRYIKGCWCVAITAWLVIFLIDAFGLQDCHADFLHVNSNSLLWQDGWLMAACRKSDFKLKAPSFRQIWLCGPPFSTSPSNVVRVRTVWSPWPLCLLPASPSLAALRGDEESSRGFGATVCIPREALCLDPLLKSLPAAFAPQEENVRSNVCVCVCVCASVCRAGATVN